jgi:hypothetical protein
MSATQFIDKAWSKSAHSAITSASRHLCQQCCWNSRSCSVCYEADPRYFSEHKRAGGRHPQTSATWPAGSEFPVSTGHVWSATACLNANMTDTLAHVGNRTSIPRSFRTQCSHYTDSDTMKTKQTIHDQPFFIAATCSVGM